jgi:hypothetical protein
MIAAPRFPLITFKPPVGWNGFDAVVRILSSALRSSAGRRVTVPSGARWASTA